MVQEHCKISRCKELKRSSIYCMYHAYVHAHQSRSVTPYYGSADKSLCDAASCTCGMEVCPGNFQQVGPSPLTYQPLCPTWGEL